MANQQNRPNDKRAKNQSKSMGDTSGKQQKVSGFSQLSQQWDKTQ